MSEIKSSRMPGTRFSVLIRNKGQFSINEISSESCDVSEHNSTYTYTDGIIEHQFQPELIRKEDNIKKLPVLLASLNNGEPMPNETTEMYLKRGHQLVNQYKKFIGAPDLPIGELDPYQFLEYIWLQEPKFTKDSWAQIRKSALVILPCFTRICIVAAFLILFVDDEMYAALSE